MSRFKNALRRFLFEEDSPTSVEYAVMVALIAVAVMFGARTMGLETKDIFEDVAEMLGDLMS